MQPRPIMEVLVLLAKNTALVLARYVAIQVELCVLTLSCRADLLTEVGNLEITEMGSLENIVVETVPVKLTVSEEAIAFRK